MLRPEVTKEWHTSISNDEAKPRTPRRTEIHFWLVIGGSSCDSRAGSSSRKVDRVQPGRDWGGRSIAQAFDMEVLE